MISKVREADKIIFLYPDIESKQTCSSDRILKGQHIHEKHGKTNVLTREMRTFWDVAVSEKLM